MPKDAIYKVLTVILSKRQLLVSGVIIQQLTLVSRVLLPLLFFLSLFQQLINELISYEIILFSFDRRIKKRPEKLHQCA